LCWLLEPVPVERHIHSRLEQRAARQPHLQALETYALTSPLV
jgi:hypothetical protein